MLYLSKSDVMLVLQEQYNTPIYHAVDKLIYKHLNTSTSLKLVFYKYIIHHFDWDVNKITNHLLLVLQNLKITAFYIRFDLDCVYKHRKQHSFYIFLGHGAHLCTTIDNITSSYLYIDNIAFTSIFNFVSKSFNLIPQLINSVVPNSSHLQIQNVLSFNISFIY